MTDLEFAEQVLVCVRSDPSGSADLVIRCQQNVLRLQVDEEAEKKRVQMSDTAKQIRICHTRIDRVAARCDDQAAGTRAVNAKVERLDKWIGQVAERAEYLSGEIERLDCNDFPTAVSLHEFVMNDLRESIERLEELFRHARVVSTELSSRVDHLEAHA